MMNSYVKFPYFCYNMKRLCSLTALLFLTFVSQSQESFYVRGIVLSEEKMTVSDVFIRINWGQKGILSREDGSFYMEATPQDTLIFNHLSFEPKAVVLSNYNTNDTLYIQLTTKSIQLDEVDIWDLGSWSEFKRKVVSMNSDSIRNTEAYLLNTMFDNVDLSKINPLPSESPPPMDKVMAKAIDPYGAGATMFSLGLGEGSKIVNKFIKKLFGISHSSANYDMDRGLSRIEKEKKQEKTIIKNAYRYSEKHIGKILDIKGTELTSFKQYADYQIDLSKDDYNMILQLKQLYKEWKNNRLLDKKEVTDTLSILPN